MSHEYSPPVSRLLSFAQVQPIKPQDWPDYVGELGFTAEHIPELLRLMADTALAEFDPDEPPPLPDYVAPETAWCAPIHAWRTLYQLQALEIFDPAIDVLQSELDEWAGEEFVDMIQFWGAPVIEPVGQLIEANLDSENRILSLINGLFKLPENFPETRDRVISILMRLLETYPQNHEDNNSFLVMGLLELKATASADLLEKVYASGRIDEFMPGTWARAQVDLGLKSESDFTKEELTPKPPPALQEMQEMYEAFRRRNMPDAFSVGMPLDPSAFPSTKPSGFNDMLQSKPQAAAARAQKGFGGSSVKGQKSKKSKKKKR
ncbi:MAG: hypothetical protein AAF892_02965 [Cyanobacteria bacterium P01_D01_bin.71]